MAVEVEAGLRPPVETLRELEIYAYQAAYYVVQNEKLAMDVAAKALTDVWIRQDIGEAAETVDKNLVKRAVIARLIPIISCPEGGST